MTQILDKPRRKQKQTPIQKSKRQVKHKKRQFTDDFDSISDSFDSSPFADDELSTLDEFEKICRQPEVLTLQRLDKPAVPSPPVLPPRRKKVVRRRQIDPTTCERDYSRDEIEFMNALNDYKRSSGRMFPTCSEILEVLRCLGYEKQTEH